MAAPAGEGRAGARAGTARSPHPRGSGAPAPGTLTSPAAAGAPLAATGQRGGCAAAVGERVRPGSILALPRDLRRPEEPGAGPVRRRAPRGDGAPLPGAAGRGVTERPTLFGEKLFFIFSFRPRGPARTQFSSPPLFFGVVLGIGLAFFFGDGVWVPAGLTQSCL